MSGIAAFASAAVAAGLLALSSTAASAQALVKATDFAEVEINRDIRELEPILRPPPDHDSTDGCDLDLMFGFSGVLASRTDRASPKIVATDLGSASTNVDSIQSPHPCLSSASPIGTSAV